MALEQTDWYYDYQLDPALTRRLSRSQLPRVGINDDDVGAWNAGYARLWLDDPVNPYAYAHKINGTPTLNTPAQRVEQVNSWQEFTPEEKREGFRVSIAAQIPVVSLTDEVRDHTARAKVEQVAGRAKAAELTLATTDDADLDAFDPDLSTHEIQEPDYAENIAAQETRNLTQHNALVDAGNSGLYELTDVSEMQSRIQWNSNVAKGLETGVQTPVRGAQRGDVALDGEEARDAVFAEVTYEWPAGTNRYIPLFILNEIPPGAIANQVFAMVYDGNNVFRSWMPFEQQPDGTWRTPSNVSYDGIAQPSSSRWRCAISYLGTSSEFEITRRVYLIPPNRSSSRVRWGGRNGVVEAVRRGQKR